MASHFQTHDHDPSPEDYEFYTIPGIVDTRYDDDDDNSFDCYIFADGYCYLSFYNPQQYQEAADALGCFPSLARLLLHMETMMTLNEGDSFELHRESATVLHVSRGGDYNLLEVTRLMCEILDDSQEHGLLLLIGGTLVFRQDHSVRSTKKVCGCFPSPAGKLCPHEANSARIARERMRYKCGCYPSTAKKICPHEFARRKTASGQNFGPVKAKKTCGCFVSNKGKICPCEYAARQTAYALEMVRREEEAKKRVCVGCSSPVGYLKWIIGRRTCSHCTHQANVAATAKKREAAKLAMSSGVHVVSSKFAKAISWNYITTDGERTSALEEDRRRQAKLARKNAKADRKRVYESWLAKHEPGFKTCQDKATLNRQASSSMGMKIRERERISSGRNFRKGRCYLNAIKPHARSRAYAQLGDFPKFDLFMSYLIGVPKEDKFRYGYKVEGFVNSQGVRYLHMSPVNGMIGYEELFKLKEYRNLPIGGEPDFSSDSDDDYHVTAKLKLSVPQGTAPESKPLVSSFNRRSSSVTRTRSVSARRGDSRTSSLDRGRRKGSVSFAPNDELYSLSSAGPTPIHTHTRSFSGTEGIQKFRLSSSLPSISNRANTDLSTLSAESVPIGYVGVPLDDDQDPPSRDFSQMGLDKKQAPVYQSSILDKLKKAVAPNPSVPKTSNPAKGKQIVVERRPSLTVNTTSVWQPTKQDDQLGRLSFERTNTDTIVYIDTSAAYMDERGRVIHKDAQVPMRSHPTHRKRHSVKIVVPKTPISDLPVGETCLYNVLKTFCVISTLQFIPSSINCLASLDISTYRSILHDLASVPKSERPILKIELFDASNACRNHISILCTRAEYNDEHSLKPGNMVTRCESNGRYMKAILTTEEFFTESNVDGKMGFGELEYFSFTLLICHKCGNVQHSFVANPNRHRVHGCIGKTNLTKSQRPDKLIRCQGDETPTSFADATAEEAFNDLKAKFAARIAAFSAMDWSIPDVVAEEWDAPTDSAPVTEGLFTPPVQWSLYNVDHHDSYGGLTRLSMPATSDPLKRYIDIAQSTKARENSKRDLRFLGGACGTGKTIFAPDMIRNGKRQLIAIPTVLAALNAGHFYQKKDGRQVCIRAGGRNVGCDINIADMVVYTTGALANLLERPWSLPGQPRDWQLVIDEAHVANVDADVLNTFAYNHGMETVLASATPLTKGPFPVEKKHEQVIYIGLQHLEDVDNWEAFRILLFVGATEDRAAGLLGQGFQSRESIVAESSFREGDCMVHISRKQTLTYTRVGLEWVEGDKSQHFDQELLSSMIDHVQVTDRRLFISSTSIVEVGVTIPSLDFVFDACERNDEAIALTSYNDLIHDPNPASVTLVKSERRTATWAEVTQVLGRVSRTKAGVAACANGSLIDQRPLTKELAIDYYCNAARLGYSYPLPPDMEAQILPIIRDLNNPNTQRNLMRFLDRKAAYGKGRNVTFERKALIELFRLVRHGIRPGKKELRTLQRSWQSVACILQHDPLPTYLESHASNEWVEIAPNSFVRAEAITVPPVQDTVVETTPQLTFNEDEIRLATINQLEQMLQDKTDPRDFVMDPTYPESIQAIVQTIRREHARTHAAKYPSYFLGYVTTTGSWQGKEAHDKACRSAICNGGKGHPERIYDEQTKDNEILNLFFRYQDLADKIPDYHWPTYAICDEPTLAHVDEQVKIAVTKKDKEAARSKGRQIKKSLGLPPQEPKVHVASEPSSNEDTGRRVPHKDLRKSSAWSVLFVKHNLRYVIRNYATLRLKYRYIAPTIASIYKDLFGCPKISLSVYLSTRCQSIMQFYPGDGSQGLAFWLGKGISDPRPEPAGHAGDSVTYLPIPVTFKTKEEEFSLNASITPSDYENIRLLVKQAFRAGRTYEYRKQDKTIPNMANDDESDFDARSIASSATSTGRVQALLREHQATRNLNKEYARRICGHTHSDFAYSDDCQQSCNHQYMREFCDKYCSHTDVHDNYQTLINRLLFKKDWLSLSELKDLSLGIFQCADCLFWFKGNIATLEAYPSACPKGHSLKCSEGKWLPDVACYRLPANYLLPTSLNRRHEPTRRTIRGRRMPWCYHDEKVSQDSPALMIDPTKTNLLPGPAPTTLYFKDGALSKWGYERTSRIKAMAEPKQLPHHFQSGKFVMAFDIDGTLYPYDLTLPENHDYRDVSLLRKWESVVTTWIEELESVGGSVDIIYVTHSLRPDISYQRLLLDTVLPLMHPRGRFFPVSGEPKSKFLSFYQQCTGISPLLIDDNSSCNPHWHFTGCNFPTLMDLLDNPPMINTEFMFTRPGTDDSLPYPEIYMPDYSGKTLLCTDGFPDLFNFAEMTNGLIGSDYLQTNNRCDADGKVQVSSLQSKYSLAKLAVLHPRSTIISKDPGRYESKMSWFQHNHGGVMLSPQLAIEILSNFTHLYSGRKYTPQIVVCGQCGVNQGLDWRLLHSSTLTACVCGEEFITTERYGPQKLQLKVIYKHFKTTANYEKPFFFRIDQLEPTQQKLVNRLLPVMNSTWDLITTKALSNNAYSEVWKILPVCRLHPREMFTLRQILPTLIHPLTADRLLPIKGIIVHLDDDRSDYRFVHTTLSIATGRPRRFCTSCLEFHFLNEICPTTVTVIPSLLSRKGYAWQPIDQRLIHYKNSVISSSPRPIETTMVSDLFPNDVEAAFRGLRDFAIKPPTCHQIYVMSNDVGEMVNKVDTYYRAAETSKYRQHTFTGLHHTGKFDEGNCSDWVNDYVRGITEKIKMFCSTIVVSSVKVTAGWDGDDLPDNEYVINFTTDHIESTSTRLHLCVKSFKGYYRELAFWRILPALVGPSHLKFHIVNGRDGMIKWETRIKDDKLYCFQRCGLTPNILNDTVVEGSYLYHSYERFLFWLENYSFVYGSDEVFLLPYKSIVYLQLPNDFWPFVNVPLMCNIPPTAYRVNGQHFEWKGGPYWQLVVWWRNEIQGKSFAIEESSLRTNEEHGYTFWLEPGSPRSINANPLGNKKPISTPPTDAFGQKITFFDSLSILLVQYRRMIMILMTLCFFSGASAYVYNATSTSDLAMITRPPSEESYRCFDSFYEDLTRDQYARTHSQGFPIMARLHHSVRFLLDYHTEEIQLPRVNWVTVLWSILTFLVKQVFIRIALGLWNPRILVVWVRDIPSMVLVWFILLGLPTTIIYYARLYLGAYIPLPSLDEYDVTEQVDCVVIDDDYPEINRDRVLFPALGTRGDVLPMLYLARLVAKFGVPSAFRVLKMDTTQDLRNVADGVHYDHIPAYLNLQILYKAGWKWIYGSFNNATHMTNIQFGPSSKWVGPFNIKNTIFGSLTKILMKTVISEFSVGVLTDSTVGRSTDGVHLLRKLPRGDHKRKPWGYTFGSDTALSQDDKIMKRVKDCQAELITDKDHVTAFQRYERIICHGGAGTMQTIIACGAIAYNANNELDRDYHRPLTPDDCVQTDPLAFLVHVYFKVGKPIPWNWFLHSCLVLMKIFLLRTLISIFFVLTKFFLIPLALFDYLKVFLFTLITFKPYVNFAIPWALTIFLPLIRFVIDYPLVLTFPKTSPFFLGMAAGYYLFHNLIEDIVTLSDYRRKRYWVQWSWVNIGPKHRLPGHVALYDSATATRYEGHFIGKTGPLEPFTFAKRLNVQRYEKDFCFEIPFNLDPYKVMQYNPDTGLYSPFLNCQTYVAAQIGFASGCILLVPVILTLGIGFSIIGAWFVGYYLRIIIHEKLNRFTDEDIPAFGRAAEHVVREINQAIIHRDKYHEAYANLAQGITNSDAVNSSIAVVIGVAHQQVTEPFNALMELTSKVKVMDIGQALIDNVKEVATTFEMPLFAKENENPEPLVLFCPHSDQADECEQCKGLTPKQVVIQNTQMLASPVAAAVAADQLPTTYTTKEQLEEWVIGKMKECSDNSSREQLIETLGFLLYTFRTSPRLIVEQLESKFSKPSRTRLATTELPVLPDISEDEEEHMLLMALHAYLTEKTKIDFSDIPINFQETVTIPRDAPESDNRHLFAKVVDWIDEFLKPLFSIIPQLIDFYNWLKHFLARQSTYIENALRICSQIGSLLYDFSFNLWVEFLQLMEAIIDALFNDDFSRRVKAVWAATTLVKAPALALRARIENELNYMQPTGRKDPVTDFSEFTSNLEELYFETHGKRPKLLAVLAPPMAGKHTFTSSHPESTVNIDDLVDQEDRQLLQARKDQDYVKINEIYKNAVSANLPSLHKNGSILFAHSPHQLTDDFFTVGVNVESVPVVENAPSNRVRVAKLARTNFHQIQYDDYFVVPDVKEASKLYEGFLSSYETGGIMFRGLARNVRFSTPMMVSEEARLAGFEPHEYVTDPNFEERCNKYRNELGVKQGVDGVFFTKTYPEKNRMTYDRYVPKYKPVQPEEEALNWEVARAFKDQFPEAFENARLTPPHAIKYYLDPKMNYSTGTPFSTIIRKRRELYAAGWDEVLIKNALKAFKEGKYPNSYYHGFIKSQVVDAEKLVAGKDPRSVVAQDLASYYIDQVIQLERNKRITWRETGVGIGMILNQNMQKLFENLEDFKNRGGYYFEADAVQFDSRNQPGNFDFLSKLTYFGYLHRGEDIARKTMSVMDSNYKSMQDSYIFGITENKWKGLTIGVSDRNEIDRLVNSYPEKFVRYHSTMTCPPKSFLPNEDNATRQLKWKQEGMKDLDGKVILTQSKHRTPNVLTHPYFAFVTDTIPEVYNTPHLTPKEGETVNTTLLRISDNLDKVYNLHFKNRGGGTGQSATSWDNTWGFRGSFVKAWLRYHDFKKTPKQFFEENVLYNTGDDSMWVIRLKKKDYDYDKFVACAAHYGVDLTLEIIDDIEQIQYLGQKVYRTRTHRFEQSLYEDWARIKLKGRQAAQGTQATLDPEPRFLVYHDQSQTLLRRSAFRYYQSSAKGRVYLHASIQRSAGQASLTAWTPSLYKLMANEYIVDVQNLARFYRQNVDLSLTKQTTGPFRQTKNPWWIVGIKGAPTRGELDGLRKRLLSRDSKVSTNERNKYLFWSFIRDNKFPSFYEVTSISMKLREDDPDKYDKFFQKFFKNPNYADQRLREWVDLIGSSAINLPREWHKLQPTLGVIFPDPVFYTPNQLVEKFIWLENGRDELSFGAFQDLVNQSPYGALCHPEVFWHNLSKPSFVQELDEHPAYVYKNQVMVITLSYMLLYPFELWIVTLPWLGLFWRIFILLMIDIPKYYSIANLLYWHNNAKSSSTISALIPRDPYIQMKRFVGLMVNFLPIELGYLVRFDLFLPFISELLPRLSKFFRYQQQAKEQPQDSKSRGVNPWDLVVSSDIAFKEQFAIADKGMIITSGTGTGKTTMLPPALDIQSYASSSILNLPGNNIIKRHIILFPRRILRDEFRSHLIGINSAINRMQQYIITRKRRDLSMILSRRHSVLLMTYGHFINRRELHTDEILKETIFYFDEFHEMSDELKVCWSLIDPQKRPLGKRILLSATPEPVPWAATTHFDAPIPPRFGKCRLYIKDFDKSKVVETYRWAREQFPEHAQPGNVIIRVVHYHEVTAVIQAMADTWNIECQEISKRTSGQPIDPNKLLVCTQIIDAGINLPGRRLLIETGMEQKNIRGQSVIEPSSANTAKQLMGRVNRYQSGDIVIRPSWSGTGRKAESYGAPGLFMYPIVADSHKVMQLVEGHHGSLYTSKLSPFMHVKNEVVRDRRQAESVFLLLELEQTVSDVSSLEQLYGKAMAAKELMNDNQAYPPGPEECEHIWLSLMSRELDTEMPFNLADSVRNQLGNVLYSGKYDIQRSYPETSRIDITTGNEVAWDSAVDGETVYFSFRSLLLKTGRWIEREASDIVRVEVLNSNAEKVLREQQVKLLPKEQQEAVNKLTKLLKSVKNPLTYRGEIYNPESPDQPISEAALSVSTMLCPVCNISTPHTHKSSDVNLEPIRAKYIKHHPSFRPFTLYFDNPFIPDEVLDQTIKSIPVNTIGKDKNVQIFVPCTCCCPERLEERGKCVNCYGGGITCKHGLNPEAKPFKPPSRPKPPSSAVDIVKPEPRKRPSREARKQMRERSKLKDERRKNRKF